MGGGEKTEDATPRRREQARKQGTVAKSMDLTNSLALLVLLAVIPWAVSTSSAGLIRAVKSNFLNLPQTLTPATVTGVFHNVSAPVLGGLAAILGVGLVVGVGANVGQVGFKLSPEALAPKFTKLNPFSGLKTLLSRRTVFEGIKATLKGLLFGSIAYGVLRARWPEIVTLNQQTTETAMSVVGDTMRTMGLRVAGVWVALAAADYIFQRKQVDDQLKMTKDEVRQEMKETETSAEVQQARARRRRRLAKGGMMSAVKSADVIVTNPTHYAVALKYEPGKDAAPLVVAKGVDFLAARIREEAQKHKVPLVPNPPLARALYKQCEVGDVVPRELFQGVAELLAYVYKTLKSVRR